MRKKLPYLLIYLFLLIFILQIAGLVLLFILPQAGQAAVEFQPQVSIPNSGFTAGQPYGGFTGTTKPIAEYIQALYKYAIGFVGILATVVMMFGGINWIIAGGNAERIGEAKAWIGASLTGLVLALSSYLILNTINPDLVNFKISGVIQAGTPPTCCDFKVGRIVSANSQISGNSQIYTCPDGSITCYGSEVCVKDKGCINNEKVCCLYGNGTDWFSCKELLADQCDRLKGFGQSVGSVKAETGKKCNKKNLPYDAYECI